VDRGERGRCVSRARAAMYDSPVLRIRARTTRLKSLSRVIAPSPPRTASVRPPATGRAAEETNLQRSESLPPFASLTTRLGQGLEVGADLRLVTV
jgi:hypothetical protein